MDILPDIYVFGFKGDGWNLNIDLSTESLPTVAVITKITMFHSFGSWRIHDKEKNDFICLQYHKNNFLTMGSGICETICDHQS